MSATRRISVGLHHIAIRTGNVDKVVNFLCKKLNFNDASCVEYAAFAAFHKEHSISAVLRSNNARVAVAKSEDRLLRNNCCYDVALQVSDLEALLRRADANRIGHSGIQTFSTATARGIWSQLESPIKGVRHSCISIKSECLSSINSLQPNFQIDGSNPNACRQLASGDKLLGHIDHVTFACDTGFSGEIIDWYMRLFGTSLKTGSSRPSRTYVVSIGDRGMRMQVLNVSGDSNTDEMEYSRINSDADSETHSTMFSRPEWTPFRLVVAEPLHSSHSDQISTFLRANHGAGVQHVAFATESISDVIRQINGLKADGSTSESDSIQPDCGLLIRPPETYYTNASKLAEIQRCGHDARVLSQLGVLVDASNVDEGDEVPEALGSSQSSNCEPVKEPQHSKQRYLMQVFTKPIFDDDTFFFEIIQRCGTTGFGAGNIKALWQATQRFMEEEQRRKASA